MICVFFGILSYRYALLQHAGFERAGYDGHNLR